MSISPGASDGISAGPSAYLVERAWVDGAVRDGVRVAIASDCNPGSSYTSSMPFCVALAVRELGMTPAEAVRAATAGGAEALDRIDVGRLVVGARADLQVLDAPSHLHLAYRPGVPLVQQVWVGGRLAVPTVH